MRELENCRLCPRKCGANRYERPGYCQAGIKIKVAKAFLHRWEEPCISGTRGSGAVFFSHCNLRCVFCQNHEISQEGFGKEISSARLAEILAELEKQGAHNINLVTPTHYIPQIREALIAARENGLRIPIIYNSSAYESVEALRSLEGLIDIYLPDLKYFKPQFSAKYSQAPDYFASATQAVLEMFRQVGSPVFAEEGLLKKGLMVRHLLLPGLLLDSKKIIDWVLAYLPKEVYLNLMSQYTPLHKASHYPEINRQISAQHYETLLEYALANGVENGFFQEVESATDEYVPSFDLQGI